MSEPSWELLGGGGVLGGPIDYIGPWSAAVAYQPGQIVSYNGVDYLAVNPSTGQTPPAAFPVNGIPQPVVNGQWLKGAGGAAVWSPIASADVGAQPFAKFHQSAGQNLAGGWNALIYQTVDVATDPVMWQSPGYWNCRQAGTYLFVAHSALTGSVISLYGLFTKGAGAVGSPFGGDPNGRVQFGPVTTAADMRVPMMSALYQCAVGDYVVPWLYATGTGATTGGGEGQAATITATRVST